MGDEIETEAASRGSSVRDVGDLLRREHERLSLLADSLRQSFEEIVGASVDVATDDEHDPEGHTIAFERQQQSALLRDAEAQMAEVDAAIERFNSGSYGHCVDCGITIPIERLAALPAATTCVECAAAAPPVTAPGPAATNQDGA